MTYRISAERLHQLMGNPALKVIDCRYDLHDFRAGYQKYLDGHIPEAWYVHLRDDLTGKVTDQSGLLPLPSPKQFQDLLQRLGITPHTIIVAYDDMAGVYASRFWWLMQAYGHSHCFVLDGGIQSYQQSYPLCRAISPFQHSTYPLKPFEQLSYYSYEQLLEALAAQTITLVDVRADFDPQNSAVEPTVQPRGSIHPSYRLPYTQHLDSNGCFQPKKVLIQNFTDLIIKDKPIVFYSSSGLSATHSFLALSLTNLEGRAAIYPGSWSEWSARQSNM